MQKDSTGKEPNHSSDFNRSELASSDQLLMLHEQINQNLSERRTLIKSRNRITQIAVASWLITLFVLFVLPELEKPKDIRIEKNVRARQLATQQIKTAALNCLPNKSVITPEISTSNNEAEAYMKKVRQLLNETNKDGTNTVSKSPRNSTYSSTYHTNNTTNHNSEHKKEISRFIYKWATVWELQDVAGYFQFYSRQFEPGYEFDNLDSWKKSRGYYTRKHEWIKIQIDNLKITEFTDSTATVTFNQSYRTPTYFDQTLKELKLVVEDNEWRIRRESGVIQHVNLDPKQ